MANQKNMQGQPGHSIPIPTNTEGNASNKATSDNYGGSPSRNVEGNTSGGAPNSDDYDDGDSKYATGYEQDTNAANRSSGKATRPIPSSGQGETPGAQRHTGYVYDEGARGVTTTRHDLVDTKPASPK